MTAQRPFIRYYHTTPLPPYNAECKTVPYKPGRIKVGFASKHKCIAEQTSSTCSFAAKVLQCETPIFSDTLQAVSLRVRDRSSTEHLFSMWPIIHQTSRQEHNRQAKRTPPQCRKSRTISTNVKPAEERSMQCTSVILAP